MPDNGTNSRTMQDMPRVPDEDSAPGGAGDLLRGALPPASGTDQHGVGRAAGDDPGRAARPVVRAVHPKAYLAIVGATKEELAKALTHNNANFAEVLAALKSLFSEVSRYNLGHEGSALLEVMCEAREAIARAEGRA